MNLLDNKAEEFVANMIKATMQKIDVKSGVCRYNYRCHRNAVHDALENNEDKIAMCFYIDNGASIIHFININKDGNYIDNTIGRWSETVDYYLIRTIDKCDFFNIDDIFMAYRKHIKSQLPYHIRLFSNVEF